MSLSQPATTPSPATFQKAVVAHVGDVVAPPPTSADDARANREWLAQFAELTRRREEVAALLDRPSSLRGSGSTTPPAHQSAPVLTVHLPDHDPFPDTPVSVAASVAAAEQVGGEESSDRLQQVPADTSSDRVHQVPADTSSDRLHLRIRTTLGERLSARQQILNLQNVDVEDSLASATTSAAGGPGGFSNGSNGEHQSRGGGGGRVDRSSASSGDGYDAALFRTARFVRQLRKESLAICETHVRRENLKKYAEAANVKRTKKYLEQLRDRRIR